MKKRSIIILVGAGIVLLGAAAVPLLIQRSIQSRIGPEHVFELSEQPKFLTDELALEKAREALKQEGLNTNAWQPVPDVRSIAPDGHADRFLSRNTINPNRGNILLNSGNGYIYMSVELDGRRIVCQTSQGK